MSTTGADEVVETSQQADPHTVTVRVRYFASARAARGTEHEVIQIPASATVADAVEHLRTAHPDSLARILEAASFLLDGVAVRDLDRPLPDGAELDVLPPFAGG
ncbi:MoaD/ThiS family protein [Saccharomonospora azurea]|uniref:Molybdopterin converting factor, small subunit n=1 Tax=Saccharomonospora azurea NA-128 TaxID=882081 RepID=H8G3S6_9PSEU|nr:MoaD/ThiS family protein [Saccharomonospora azurea]EHK87656.1 molybdopterin converting factor, small subunit [Saccharomonospora azurea SZMC 14600]EHY89094.1 molybdopterin converting factor, small subunit [Saccharomonospora azurea NA-128]